MLKCPERKTFAGGKIESHRWVGRVARVINVELTAVAQSLKFIHLVTVGDFQRALRFFSASPSTFSEGGGQERNLHAKREVKLLDQSAVMLIRGRFYRKIIRGSQFMYPREECLAIFYSAIQLSCFYFLSLFIAALDTLPCFAIYQSVAMLSLRQSTRIR